MTKELAVTVVATQYEDTCVGIMVAQCEFIIGPEI
jgi:hypothetical protein